MTLVQPPGGGSAPVYSGARAYNSALQSLAGSVETAIGLDSESWDTDAYHFASAAALTGTVSKASGSAAIVGAGTLFLSELSINQVISIPGTATEKCVVLTITDDTHLTVTKTLANTASGQTATRVNSAMAIPAGKGGYFFAITEQSFAQSATGSREAYFIVNHTHSTARTYSDNKIVSNSASNPTNMTVPLVIHLNDGDWIEAFGYQTSGGALNSSFIGPDEAPSLSLTRLG